VLWIGEDCDTKVGYVKGDNKTKSKAMLKYLENEQDVTPFRL